MQKSLLKKFILLNAGATAVIIFLFIIITRFNILPLTFGLIVITYVILFAVISFIFYSYITKPIKTIVREMKALLVGKTYNKIFTTKTDEIGIVAHFFNEITRALERVSVDLKDHKRLSTELSVAQKIQRDLLPKSNPEVPGLDITAKTKSAAEIGGDSFDFITKNSDTYFFVGDVTGHGIPAGLVMIMVDTLINTFMDMYDTLFDILVNTNKYLHPRIQSTVFMTMVLFKWNNEAKKLSFIGAGHENIMHYSATTKELTTFKSGGIALGMVPDISKMAKEQELDYKTGDYLILYSDGITDAKNANGEPFSLEKFQALIKQGADKGFSSDVIFKDVSQTLAKYIEGAIQEDDMTLIVIKNAEKVSKAKETTEWEIGSEGLIKYEKGEIKESGMKEK